MTKAELVRRAMARAKLNGTDHEKLVKHVMKVTGFKRGLAVTYIRKIDGTPAYKETLKLIKAQAAAKTERKVTTVDVAVEVPAVEVPATLEMALPATQPAVEEFA